MVTKSTGRPRGRPKLALRDDPDRYILAYYEAIARINDKVPGFSRRGLALHIAMVCHGALVNEPENIERWRSGQGGTFRAFNFRGDPKSIDPRNLSAFHPLGDGIERKVRAINSLKASSRLDVSLDRLWWAVMVDAWMFSLAERDFILAQQPILWCRQVGEYPFQQRVLARFVEGRFGVTAQVCVTG